MTNKLRIYLTREKKRILSFLHRTALLLVFQVLIGTTVHASDKIFVSQSGDDANDGLSPTTAVSSLSVAINLADIGDTIYISGFLDISSDPANTEEPKIGINLQKNLILLGTSNQTDGLDGKNTSRLLRIGANVICTIKNLTLKNGMHPDEGGAIILNGGSLDTENTIFKNNTTISKSTSNGGAIKINAHKGLFFKTTLFINNTAGKGGAIYMQDSNTPDAAIQIESCSFISNSTMEASGGSAMFVRLGNGATNNTINFINTTIAQNKVTATRDGGAVFLYRSAQVEEDTSSVNFINCTITENTTAGSAGHCAGIKVFNVDGQFTAKLNIRNSIIEGNYASQSSAYSDIVYASPVDAEILTINNSIIGRDGVSGGANAIPAECYTGENMFNYLTSSSTSLDLEAELGTFDTIDNAYLLQDESPAINYGNAQYLKIWGINIDQLGNTRPFSDNKCYAGAVEKVEEPEILPPGPSYKHLIMYGQSLSTGHQSYPVISTENIDGNYMIGNQVWINYGNNNFNAFVPLQGTISAAFQSQENIRSRSAGTIAECPLLGAANHIRLKNSTDTLLATSCGTSGMTIEQLSKESQTKDLYNDFVNTLQYASNIAKHTNSTINCPAIFWMQGEWNYQGYQEGLTPGSTPTGDKDEYKSLLLTLKNNMQIDITTEYNQSNAPLFITYQTGVQYIKGKKQAIGMAQLEASNENSDIVMAGPVYQMTDRGGHLDPNGYRWYGELLGKVYYKTQVLKEDFKPLQPKRISRTSNENQLEIKFVVPQPPLVFDELVVEKVKDFGFEIYLDNIKQTISEVSISDDCVYVSCTAPLNGQVEVVYASKNTEGHGNLRDSDSYQAFFKYIDLDEIDDNGEYVYPRDATETTLRPSYEPKDENGNIIYAQAYPLYNYCVSFYYKLNANENRLSVTGLDSLASAVQNYPNKNIELYQKGKSLILSTKFKTHEKINTSIYNLSGKNVLSFNDYTFTGLFHKSYSLNQLSKGIYIVKVTSGNEAKTIKICIN